MAHANGNGNLQTAQEIALSDPLALVERRAAGRPTLQKRYSTDPLKGSKTPWNIFRQAMTAGHMAIYDEPAYSPESRKRDKWLLDLSRMGALIDGVIYSMAQRDASRGYALVGPVSTVLRVRNILHTADRGSGWREHVSRLATSYYCTDIGALPQYYLDGSVEISDSQTGAMSVTLPPLRSIFHYDPTACTLSGDWQRPVTYHRNDKEEPLLYGTVGRFCSMPSLEEKYHGLGWCFMSRVTQLLRLLFSAVFGMQELMDARVPQGFMFISGMSRTELEEAMGSYEGLIEQFQRKHFGATFIIANDQGQGVDGKFLPVSQFPEGFNFREFVELLMLGIALAAGLPASDLWDVSTGRGFGREGENRESFRRAGSKGRNAFALAHQESLQRVLPGSVSFQYERHNADERMIEAEAAEAWLRVGELEQKLGVPQDVYLSHMVDAGAIPPSATEAVEDAIATDVGELKETADMEPAAAARTTRAVLRRARHALSRDSMVERHRKAILENPSHFESILHARRCRDRDPIAHLAVDDNGQERMFLLWDSAAEALQRRSYVAAAITRQSETVEDLYEARWRDLVRATEEGAVESAAAQGELEALVMAAMVAVYLRDSGDTTTDEYQSALDVLMGSHDAADVSLLRDAVRDTIEDDVAVIIEAEALGAAESTFLEDLAAGEIADAETRWPLWAGVLAVAAGATRLAVTGEQAYRWQIDPLKESCADCLRLNGQVHTAAEWLASGYLPRRTILECYGRYCGCMFVETDEEMQGEF